MPLPCLGLKDPRPARARSQAGNGTGGWRTSGKQCLVQQAFWQRIASEGSKVLRTGLNQLGRMVDLHGKAAMLSVGIALLDIGSGISIHQGGLLFSYGDGKLLGGMPGQESTSRVSLLPQNRQSGGADFFGKSSTGRF